jgi:isopenicillin N synthase-like dioxygenase
VSRTRVEPLDCQALGGGETARAALGRRLLAELSARGFAALHGHGLGARPAAVLGAARALFALPAEDKDAIHIRRSAHFRGYSEMKNERDWREQLHLAREEAPVGPGPAYERLHGPNLWPAPLGAPFRAAMLDYLEAGGHLGAALLAALALGLDLAEGAFGAAAEGHLLLKLICYHPQGETPRRVGVAPHCDWSWITLLLQDAPGLEVRGPDGRWRGVPLLPGTLLLNAGELLELASGGAVAASPHRVLNPSRKAARLGVPLFLNPALDEPVRPLRSASPQGGASRGDRPRHVHRVLAPGVTPAPFVFGESEWRRKGLGRWCHDGACLA